MATPAIISIQVLGSGAEETGGTDRVADAE